VVSFGASVDSNGIETLSITLDRRIKTVGQRVSDLMDRVTRMERR